MPSRVVMGIGNRYRGDDAAGCLVADRLLSLRERGFDVLESGGDLGQMLDCFGAYEQVILVDATPTKGPLKRLDGAAQPLPSDLSSTSSHALGVASGVEIARTLGRLPQRLTVYLIPGQDFAHKEGVSSATAQAVKQATAMILGEFF